MFTRLSGEHALNSKIEIENLFLVEYLPSANGDYVKVYLYGLSLAQRNPDKDNTLENIAKRLSLDTATVLSAYKYWQDCNLVSLSEDSVIYLPISNATRAGKKINKDKYKDFNHQLEATIKDRPILPNEYNEYYFIMESLNIEWQAMVAIIAYCVRLKGASITYPYILTVARNLAQEGCTNFDKVCQKLEEYELLNPDLCAVLSALKIKRKPDHQDKRLFIKWTKEMGFELSTVIKVAKDIKRGGVERLDWQLCKYYENKLLSYEEICAYNDNISTLRELAKNINRALGLYYEQVDIIVDTYISGWIMLGFENDSLLTIAEYCFKHNIRTLDGMNDTIQKFYQKGLLSLDSIHTFLNDALSYDNEIKSVLQLCGLTRPVISRDRDIYRTWTQEWKTEKALIEHAALLAAGKSNPISYMNSILASYFEKGVKTLEQVKQLQPPAVTTVNTANNSKQKAIQSLRNLRRERETDAQELYERALNANDELKAIQKELSYAAFEGDLEKVDELERQKAGILLSMGITHEMLNPPYQCELCKDTGYNNDRVCECIENDNQSVKQTYSAEELNALFDNLKK